MSSFRMSSIQFMNNYKTSLNKTYQEQAKIMEQGDGTSIHRGSDDPIGYSKLLRYTVSENENDQYHKNVDTAISWMKTSDSVVASISDRMKTYVEKTVAAANSYNSEADFRAIAKEMFAQVEEIVSEANTQLGDRYIFSGQRDTTEPFVLSHDTYDRGIAKTLDAKQAAFFKGTSGDDNATLFQFLTIEYTDSDTGVSDTYYLDTQSGYVYTKKFVDEGYKELIAQGYKNIDEVDKLSVSSQKLARTYAAGSISLMSLDEAWETVNQATEEKLLQTIRAVNINDTEQNALRSALKVIFDNDLNAVNNAVNDAKDSITSSLKSLSPEQLKFNYTFRSNGSTVTTGIYTEEEAATFRSTLPDNTSAIKGSDATTVNWTTYNSDTYDSDTGVLDSTTATTSVTGTAWNSDKSVVVDDILTAIEEYASQKLYTEVPNPDKASDTTPSGKADETAIADNITQNILDTLYADIPASNNYDTTPKKIALASNVTADQVDTLARAKIVSMAVAKAEDYNAEKFLVSHAFNNQGLIHSAVEEVDKNDYVEYKQNPNGTWKVTGIRVAMFSVDSETRAVTEGNKLDFTFSTIKQRMVNYLGDDNYISMVKMNGANDKSSDIVNLNGNDLFGCDIFDNADSGNEQSGCAMLNNMLTVYTFTNACDEHWLTSDGVTLSDVSHATVTIAETTLGSRLNLYNSVAEMLDNQSTTITNDITNVSGTDVAQLATRLMEMTTLYNMALALGGRVLPQSLADYL